MEADDALNTFGQPVLGQAAPYLVLDVHIVMGLGPVMTYEHLPHRCLLVVVGCRARGDQQLANGSVLEARHPTSCRRSTSPTGKRTI
ncbi:MAG: hypothetical protein AVDCRST_MAG10-2027 [uncultured Acidimicrobiales bacterium]|uniref:Uncharacterized protein n=1 Tax=uncultured Acidimicrobiales bacterium TaxID=310071 RepID=A0A6J4IEI3_9ACTN|nr:MAG: hypothetical protein AVDCRST_MAG10-2027 [uncultured Acidimicrobiales bacterium]